MRSPRTRPARLLAALLALTLLAAACGGDDDEAGGDTGTETNGGASGSISVSGSSTVEPISALNAEKFAGENPDVSISVVGPGTGDGFQAFCNAETQISDASRPISESEIESCEETGVEFVELQVAIDGLTVMTSPENDSGLECLDFPALYALVGPESQGVDTWAEAAPLAEELGSAYADEFPDEDLVITGPGEESGTYDTFVELVIEDIADERGVEAETRPDYTSSPNDNVIVEGISGSPTSLGWVGYAFYVENQDALQAFSIAGEDGTCVEPSDETISNGEYPLSRPLFIYVNAQMAEDNQALADFIDFYLSDEGIGSVSEAGYVQLEDQVLEETRTRWESRETGTQKG